ncbi:YceI family protein [Defluviimonas sp. SAOS-178_SWC]|uniref:YceI family protein n=1 Tax=Defluviimonas sp. SAOS-178_SWC TaxID=3121287 RepID=UPI003221F53D
MRPLLLALMLAAASPAVAAPIRYHYDAAGSTVGFEADFGQTPIRGQMPVADITLALDFDRVAASHVEVTLDAAAARANIPFATQAMKGEDVLATRDHPQIRFESTSVRPTDTGAEITGRLTIRGISHEAVLDAVLYRPPGSDPVERDDLKILLTGAVSRSAFGATGFAHLVGDQVRLKILAHIRRAG